jgi:GNAT superfamily N-acetyltransferase
MDKSYGVKLKLAPRTDANLLSYLHSDGEGSFVAADQTGGIVGSAFSHVWGATGWVGPLSILPSYQSKGVGKELLRHSLRHLEDEQCVDIGLETMPENATNLGMYLKVGLRTEGLVIVLGRKLEKQDLEEEPAGEVAVERFSESSVQDYLRSQVRRISGALRLGLDYTKEVDDTRGFSFGDTIIATSKGKVVGFSVVHTVPRRTDTLVAGIRVLAVDPQAKGDILEPLLASSELLAADAGMAEVSVAIPSTCRRALDSVFSRGYSVVQSFERMMWMGSSGMSDRFYNLCSWSG